MNVIVTAQVTYEIFDVANFEEAVEVFQTCATGSARYMEGANYIGTKEMFGTEMNEDGTFKTHPQIWELEEVE